MKKIKPVDWAATIYLFRTQSVKTFQKTQQNWKFYIFQRWTLYLDEECIVVPVLWSAPLAQCGILPVQVQSIKVVLPQERDGRPLKMEFKLMSSLVPYFLLHRRLLLNLDFLQSSYKFFWDFYDNVNKNTTKVCLIFVKTTNTCLDFFAIVNWLFSNWSWCWRWIVSYEHHRLIECYRKSSQILMRLEELTHTIAIGSSHTF